MPFDVYAGTLSQYVSRLVNLLTGMTNSPFKLAAQWSGGTYPWYALQYSDPNGYTNNNIYIIIGPTAFRMTTKPASTNTYDSWNWCNTLGNFYGRPGNVYGIFVGVATSFDTTNFAVPSTASLYATFGIRAYDLTVTNNVSATACNDTTIPYRYVDLQSTFYTWYDQYGFTFIQVPVRTTYRDVPFTMHAYRLMPFNTNITQPWWTLFTDQTALSTVADTQFYNIMYTKFPTYPTNLCGTLTYTTSSSGYGICMDNPTSLNMPPGIASYLTGSNVYVHTFASSLRQMTRPCPATLADGPRGPMSYYTQVRRFLDPSSSLCTWLPYGEIVYLPTALSSVDGKVYAFQPVVNVAHGAHPWSLTGIFAPVTTLLPLSYVDSGISPGDVLSIQGNQYVAVQYNNIMSGYNYDPCLGGGGNNTVNSDYTFYAIRYA